MRRYLRKATWDSADWTIAYAADGVKKKAAQLKILDVNSADPVTSKMLFTSQVQVHSLSQRSTHPRSQSSIRRKAKTSVHRKRSSSSFSKALLWLAWKVHCKPLWEIQDQCQLFFSSFGWARPSTLDLPCLHIQKYQTSLILSRMKALPPRSQLLARFTSQLVKPSNNIATK